MKIKDTIEKLEHHVGAFVPKGLYDRVQAAAEQEQRPVSQWLRILLEKATAKPSAKK